jgi:hypothetical protein
MDERKCEIMQATINITLPNEIRAALEDLIQKTGLSPEAAINEALREYVFFQRVRLLRERMSARAKKLGIQGEQDVFDLVS